jgi:hypothetical protein
MVKHRAFLAVTAVEVALVLGLMAWSTVVERRDAESLPSRQELVRRLELTDLALWTEARYTRHPSQADRFAPFQDFPSALEHFPAGSVVVPPTGWRLAPAGE